MDTRPWKWFFVRLRYLMVTDTPLHRMFAPQPEPPDDENDTTADATD